MLEGYTSTFPRPEFWEGLSAGRFDLPRCAVCDEWQAPGSWKCGRCGSDRLDWHDASGRGSVYSLLERITPPGLGPAVIAVLNLDEGPSMMASIQGHPRVEVGMRVQAVVPGAQGPEGLPLFTESAI